MGRGIKSYQGKEKRAMRRRNHIARDLGSNKYRQRIINPKRDGKYPDVNDWLMPYDPEKVPEGDWWLVGWSLEEEDDDNSRDSNR